MSKAGFFKSTVCAIHYNDNFNLHEEDYMKNAYCVRHTCWGKRYETKNKEIVLASFYKTDDGWRIVATDNGLCPSLNSAQPIFQTRADADNYIKENLEVIADILFQRKPAKSEYERKIISGEWLSNYILNHSDKIIKQEKTEAK